ncbi:hypothetical protein ZHAS_00019276 [Anopheles sinensis]|uniref:Uncharacterized protein n=1 Tax=Anopheles sinensis TaxID=74873 RepID=A0A084WLZ0_ANOSI|nr:hypothetical protein ZHAS_00019276 [Anopheles sinensis]
MVPSPSVASLPGPGSYTSLLTEYRRAISIESRFAPRRRTSSGTEETNSGRVRLKCSNIRSSSISAPVRKEQPQPPPCSSRRRSSFQSNNRTNQAQPSNHPKRPFYYWWQHP